ncbi:ribosomal RNA small subunit methyltransferase G isoform X2 [Juglans microcarpa x Juglans regia]|uniref:ribosomal RNA small subunit methyltransferase G isoform X2 n=1 Tax=Juglans microcarpa x Juglans regia TaxID=2249226 RepID=UPI001B7DC720|nr:ribosomal RNA small subunit methyltransferase G isoform X2 [Juglans microcarpa x Juglans regia]
MLVWRGMVPNIQFSRGNFFKHLPASTPTSICCPCNIISTGTLFTTRALRSSYFESLASHQKDQVHLYVDTLLQWNQRMNLTAVTEVNEVMERHIEDSLAIIPPMRSSYASHCNDSVDSINLVDVGSGAGLPGLILAIACPDWKVTLLESMNKRCVFLENAIGLAGLSNVRVVRGRAENLGQDLCFREKFDVAVARAVAEMRILAEYCLPLVRVGGLFVAAKGHDPQEEVRNAERAIQMMGSSLLQLSSGGYFACMIHSIHFQSSPLRLGYEFFACTYFWHLIMLFFVESHSPYGQRTAIICLKDRPTPRKYPRDPGVPAKAPL